MALLTKKQRRRARRQAGAIARAQTGPLRRELVRQRGDAYDLFRAQTAASESLARALSASLRQASRNVRRSGGILPRDVSTALKEFQSQRVAAHAGAKLQNDQYSQELEDAVEDIRAKLADVAATKGEVKASTIVDLLNTYRSQAMEQKRLQLSKRSQRLEERRFKYDKQQDRRAAAGERGERRSGVRDLFKKALADVKANQLEITGYEPGTDNKVTRPITEDAARSQRGETIRQIASQLTDGNRRLARVVWERWTGIGPSRDSLALARAIDYDFGWSPRTLRMAIRHYGGDLSRHRSRPGPTRG